MIDIINSLVILIGSTLFISKRLLRYLHYLQQENYTPKRFWNWVWSQRAFDTRGTLIAIAAAIAIAIGAPVLIASMTAALALISLACWEEDPRVHAKISLKMTPRATRIFFTALSLYLASAFIIIWFCYDEPIQLWLLQIILFQLNPGRLVGACGLLNMGEHRRQKEYIQDAKQILSKLNPFVIGITGSYGKTSTKDALGRILQLTVGPTFWPTGGINTEMGITREIRQKMQPGYKYAVMEMGAYGPGSIKKLCELTPPHAAIITSIGQAHLERYKTEDIVKLAKSELAQAVPTDGILVCNADSEGARWIAHKYPKKHTLLYGHDNTKGDLNCWIANCSVSLKGTTFTFVWNNKSYTALTPLFGKTAISNLAGAFTMACQLGANPEYVLAAIQQLEPVDNRLQVQKDGEITYVHDAYNSNPIGFAAALEVMAALPGKRRILMTPGMIELGHLQVEKHEQIGRMAATVCDYALIIGDLNKHSLSQGLISGGLPTTNLICCRTRTDGFAELRKLLCDGDIVLLENDLGDIHETKVRF